MGQKINPIGFRLGCSLLGPCVESVDVESTADALVQLYAGKAVGAAADALKKKTGIDATNVLEAATSREAEAEAKRRADEVRRRAEAEAERKAAEAQRRLEEEAKKKLKGLFNR